MIGPEGEEAERRANTRRVLIALGGVTLAGCMGLGSVVVVLVWMFGVSLGEPVAVVEARAAMEAACGRDQCAPRCRTAARHYFQVASPCGDDPNCIDAAREMNKVTDAMCESRAP